MVRHLARTSVVAILVVLCMVLPFLPGEYDGLALALSTMAQLVGIIGVVLVPLGVIWLVYEHRARARPAGSSSASTPRYWLALVSLLASTVVALIVSIGAFATVGRSFGLIVMAGCLWGAVRLAPRVTALRGADDRALNPAPLYLIVIPLVAAIARIALLDPVSERGRNRAIDNSASLIADIERYREINGRYPLSLLSVNKDYKPGVIGIEKYHYEPSGEAYNVYFEHVAHLFGTREFVVYNRLGKQEMTSHAMDLLQSTPAELALGRGYHAVHDASRPHWKRFLFD